MYQTATSNAAVSNTVSDHGIYAHAAAWIRFLYRGIVKNLMDCTAAFLALVLLSPLFVLIAIRLKCGSRGPIFMKQTCEGLRGRPFKMYKFRTHEIMAIGSARAPKYALRETYIGSILKEANLENLPQLFNVFLCDMSLVGPRPEPVKLMINNVGVEQAVPQYQSRRDVKPGMTGWARINGSRGPLRSVGEAAQRVSYDVDYTKHASFKVDFYILRKTLRLLKYA